MAKIETFVTNPNLPPDHAIEFVNIGASVGLNGVNRKDDVTVVQALLKCALDSHPHFKDVKFPEPNGSLTRDLIKIIKKYQRFNNRKNPIKIPVDGRIDPLRNGLYVPGRRRFWTIFELNSRALETSLLNVSGDPIKAICRRWSAVGAILNSGDALGLSF